MNLILTEIRLDSTTKRSRMRFTAEKHDFYLDLPYDPSFDIGQIIHFDIKRTYAEIKPIKVENNTCND